MEGLEKVMSVPFPASFVIGDRIAGIVNTRGQKAGQEQNWGYHAMDPDGQPCILLFCNPGVYTILDSDALDRIRVVDGKQVSWYLMRTGYVGCHTETSMITMHQFLMNHYGHGRGGPSVDHINHDKLDNRITNLRIATQSEQNTNRDKVRRHQNAKPLPDELAGVTFPKFVVFYDDKVTETKRRQFFTVENHPLQKLKKELKKTGKETRQTLQLKNDRWATSKSDRVNIHVKLASALEYVQQLDALWADPSYTFHVMKSSDQDVTDGKEEAVETNDSEEVETEEEEPRLPAASTASTASTATAYTVKQKLDSGYQKKESTELKQWKTVDILRVFRTNQEHLYKEHCEANNDLDAHHPTWESEWNTFATAVRTSKTDPTPIVKAFLVNLRRIRHNALILSKNRNPVIREDRQQWPATTVVKAFLTGQLDAFKAFTEQAVGDLPTDPRWCTSWAKFVGELEKHRADQEKLATICSAFMAAQRAKKWRRSKEKQTE